MKKRYQMIKRSMITVMMAALMVIMNSIPVMAQENINDKVFTEYNSKKEAGMEVYDLRDDDGNFMGYYEPYSETNPNPNEGIMPHPAYSIDWTIDPGRVKFSGEQFILINGMKMDVIVSQNRNGRSYLTFYRASTGTSLRFNNTETTNGWNGTITFSGIAPGGYSFGIENNSLNPITYTGLYLLAG